ncbi:hypothetical protein [Luteirhabdus pelagi]|uniref:hypothetical protein n=1 Tax=Luteirhabdus pelagi TaxID=2792783 RepID=UPI00193A1AC1|nr:hypothetical protein [Luteirhabdus pelagi]
MKRNILLLFILVLTFKSGIAQFGMLESADIKKIKEIPLVVVLETPDDKLIKKLEKKGNKSEVAEYKKAIEDYNRSIKSAFENNWTFSKELIFVSDEEIDSYSSKKNEYAFFQRTTQKGVKNSSAYLLGSLTCHYYTLNLAGKKKPVFFIMDREFPSEADFKFLIQVTEMTLEGRENSSKDARASQAMISKYKDNARQLLEKKILLVDKNDVSDKTLKNMDKIYPFEYRITDKVEIDKAIIEEDQQFAYYRIQPVGQVTSNSGSFSAMPYKSSKIYRTQYIIDAENGDILGFIMPNTNYEISVKDLKSMVKTLR